MPKLHELLAVEGPLKGQADKCRGELLHTFDKKTHHFGEKTVTVIPLHDTGAPAVVEEQLDLQTTIRKELAWLSDLWAKAMDGAFAVAQANTGANADVILEDGTTLLSKVPATALLELLKRAAEIQELASKIPTLDPTKGYQIDNTHKESAHGVYKAREDRKIRTKKETKALVLYDATDKHPAQVKEITVDEPIATIQTQQWSGLITPAEKSDMLDRAEQLTRALKSALSRANSIDIPKSDIKVGKILLSYVFDGKKAGKAQG